MKFFFTRELSSEVLYLSELIEILQTTADGFFANKDYGEDLKVIYISLFCMADQFLPFFRIRKPEYRKNKKIYIHKGVQIESEACSFFYELRLNNSTYIKVKNNVHENLASDILNSLNIISSCLSVKRFDLGRFKEDFSHLFKEIDWKNL